jgi:hypothetical protein
VNQAAAPPKALEFSANPTVQELFRARVFEEPLVLIGGEATPSEGTALADALLGHVQRSGLDDFSSLTAFLENNPRPPWAPARPSAPLSPNPRLHLPN